jgi:hypothetical protein
MLRLPPRVLSIVFAITLSACASGGPDSTGPRDAAFEDGSVEPSVDLKSLDASFDAGASGAAGRDASTVSDSGGTSPIDASSIGTCSREGGFTCGGNGIAGDPRILYTCSGGLRVAAEVCDDLCDRMPSGVPDRCPPSISDIPAELIDVLDARPYVEGSCTAVDYDGWPYEAKRCSYTSGGISTSVVVANPSPERVARWVIDASGVVRGFDALRESDPTSWLDGLKIIARHTVLQSSRIFPLEGGIVENLGSGYVNYSFERGVTVTCGSGCYCRINSLHRTEFCAYREALGDETDDACLARVGNSGYTEGWGGQCLSNHRDAWNSDRNEHFRAKVWQAQRALASSCGTTCSASQMLSALRTAFP